MPRVLWKSLRISSILADSERGFALVSTLLLLLLLATVVTTSLTAGGLQTRISRNLQSSLQAQYLAEAAIQHAFYQLRLDTGWRNGIGETPFGSGTHSVTVSEVPQGDINLVVTGKVGGAQSTMTAILRTLLIRVAGNGSSGYGGDGGLATAARLDAPMGVVIDGSANLYIADRDNHRVRRVDASTGVITTVAGTGTAGYNGNGILSTSAELNKPTDVFIDAGSNLYIADRSNHRVRRVDASTGVITTVAGTGTAGYNGDGILATSAQLDRPSGVFIDAGSNLYIADRDNHRVRRVDASTGMITTVAGTGTAGYNGDGILATSARLNEPTDVFIDAGSNLYIADRSNHRVRRVGASTGVITTVAGTGTAGYNGDGILATSARLDQPTGVFIDAGGNLYIADFANHRVRKVDAATMIITTIAGMAISDDGGDMAVPTSTPLRSPSAVFVDSAGNVYVAERGNHRVRRTRLRLIRWKGV